MRMARSAFLRSRAWASSSIETRFGNTVNYTSASAIILMIRIPRGLDGHPLFPTTVGRIPMTRGRYRCRIRRDMFRKISLFVALLIPISLHAETGYETWLRYAALDDLAAQQYRAVVPATLTTLNDAGLEQSAQQELVRGIRGM